MGLKINVYLEHIILDKKTLALTNLCKSKTGAVVQNIEAGDGLMVPLG